MSYIYLVTVRLQDRTKHRPQSKFKTRGFNADQAEQWSVHRQMRMSEAKQWSESRDKTEVVARDQMGIGIGAESEGVVEGEGWGLDPDRGKRVTQKW